ncbi:MAG: Multiple RNA-binding domain-containing protein 1 [Candelina submexicana]|nr:MAG: Multiple RNA-binding domain-containing protein 1 [Candelina submexicana]
MASSRIFVRGLPPNLTVEEFKKHFSKQQSITDAKLIAHRRIGYVGYRTPEEALKAVKYHDRSFIRMSRLAVELARPIVNRNLSEALGEHEIGSNIQDSDTNPSESDGLPKPEEGVLKRKRSTMVEKAPDPKLQEFLEVMQPPSKTKIWANEGNAELAGATEDCHELPDIQLSIGNRESSYGPAPQRAKRAHQLLDTATPTSATQLHPAGDVSDLSHLGNPIADEKDFNAQADQQLSHEKVCSDADWLRSRTSRLLGLVEDNSQEDAAGGGRGQAAEVVEHSKTEAPELSKAGLRDDQSTVDDRFTPSYTFTNPDVESIRTTGRLFVRNLPYDASEKELREYFSLQDVHLAANSVSSGGKGLAYVQYKEPALAVQAFLNLDGKIFQGRLLHILPAAAKRETKLDDYAISKLPLKKQKQIKRRRDAASTTFNWNSMFMSVDAVNSSIADRLGISKSALLDPTSSDAAVKQAHAETHVIQETKAYFAANGVSLKAFQNSERGEDTLLVKNFPYGTKSDELRTLLHDFGSIDVFLMPPAGTIAIAKFAQVYGARAAFRSLAYRRFKDSVLFLEQAPKDLFSAQASTLEESTGKSSAPTSAEHGDEQPSLDTCTLFVRNLNFSTATERLTDIFRPLAGFISARVKTKPDIRNPGHMLSMGFGFLEFRSKVQAQAALSAMEGYILDGHRLSIKASQKGSDAIDEGKREQRKKDISRRSTKIIIKNLPFETSKKDVRALFGPYGQLRSVRVPKKLDHSTRGFAFADFLTAREAENAISALRDTHLLGRRLVLDYAIEDPVDAEEEMANMQKKVGRQVNQVALQRLTGAGRKKFDVERGSELGKES